jgi:Cu-Zn family superoxide dismutase
MTPRQRLLGARKTSAASAKSSVGAWLASPSSVHTHPGSSFGVGLALFAMFAACTSDDRPPGSADLTAVAEMLDESGRKIGTAVLRQAGDRVEIELSVQNLTPGEHALHIHNVGDCHTPGGDGEAFTNAGEHFNPTKKKHGRDNPGGPHAGDLPNFTVAADGTAKVEVENDLVTLESNEPNSLFQPGGTCLVIHAGPDDYKTDPTGNAGDRVACGVITRR